MKIVAYYRVSTQKQGVSGLGLDAQRAAIAATFPHAEIVAEFVEIESGRKSNRPKIAEAIATAKRHKVKLVIAKLDRLARNVAFVSTLMETGVDFVCCDNPTATKLTIHVLAAVAENEAEMISARTKAALQAAKARGKVLGGDRGHLDAARAVASQNAQDHAEGIMKKIAKVQASGATSFRQIAIELNGWGVKTSRDRQWSASTVARVMARAA